MKMAAEQNIQHACFYTFLSQKKEVKEHYPKCHSQCVYCSSVMLTNATTFKLGVKTIKNNLTVGTKNDHHHLIELTT